MSTSYLTPTPSTPPPPHHASYHHIHPHYVTHQHQPLMTPAPSSSPSSSQSFGVAFGALPGSHSQPGSSLSYGFGLGPASSLGIVHPSPNPPPPPQPPTTGWGQSQGSMAWGQQQQQQQQQTIHSSPSTAGRRRRRSLTPPGGGQDGEVEMDEIMSSTTTTGTRPMRGVGHKKARLGAGGQDNALGGHQAREGQDLGKALASLSKESLLGIMTSLVTTQPHLRPVIQSLLPPPTLANTLSTLAALERAVTSALPTGAHLRDEYILGRIRVPLEEYVVEAKSFLTAFTSPPPQYSVAAATATTHGGGNGGEDDIGHPSTTFAFLHALTSSLRRLEVALPPSAAPTMTTTTTTSSSTHNQQNPLASHLLPLTINAWHVFLTRLSTSVNTQGRIISAQMVRGWFDRLDELCVASPNVSVKAAGEGGLGVGVQVGRREGMAKRALEGVRDRMRREVGWLVGVTVPTLTTGAGGGMMDREEEEL